MLTLIANTLALLGLISIVLVILGYTKYYLLPEIRIIRVKYYL